MTMTYHQERLLYSFNCVDQHDCCSLARRLSLLLDKGSRDPSGESLQIPHVLVVIGYPVCSRAPTEKSLENSLLGFLDAVFRHLFQEFHRSFICLGVSKSQSRQS